jgi:hypothetical protein
MRDLGMHIMDLLENSARAGASSIRLELVEEPEMGTLGIIVEDNGKGMSPEEIPLLLDPFYTTKEGKRVGLGVPLFYETCKRCGGELEISAMPNGGLRVQARLSLDHIDLPPYGDLGAAISGFLLANPHIRLELVFRRGKKEIIIDSTQIPKKGEMLDPKGLLEIKGLIGSFLNNQKHLEAKNG